MENKNNDTYFDEIDFDEIEKLFKKKPEPIKQTSQQDIENPDTIMNMINYKKHIDGILLEYQKNKKTNKNREKTANKSIGNTKKTKKSKARRALEISAGTLIISACAAALILAGIHIGGHVVKPIANRFKFEEDLKASLKIVTTDAKNNLEYLNLGYTDEDGTFTLNDNEVSDYAKLGLTDPAPTEIRAYMEVIKDGKEKEDFIQSVYYTDGEFEHTFISFGNYLQHDGFIDVSTGIPSSIVFYNMTEAQLVDAYNNGTIYEVVHDLTNTHSKGGR